MTRRTENLTVHKENHSALTTVLVATPHSTLRAEIKGDGQQEGGKGPPDTTSAG